MNNNRPMKSLWKVAFGTLLCAVVFALAVPSADAAGKYYVHAKNGSDGNGCKKVTKPCKTINGVMDKISASADPSNTTVYLKGTFHEAISINGAGGANLTGLRFTATDTKKKPTINGKTFNVAMEVKYIDNLKIDHLEFTNSPIGLSVYGSSGDPITNMQIMHNTIFGSEASNRDVIGLHVENVKDSVIESNKIKDTVFSDTNSAGTYEAFGIYLEDVAGVAVKDNKIVKTRAVNTNTSYSGASYLYAYGVYLNDVRDVTLRSNEIDGVKAKQAGPPDGLYRYSEAFGLYATTGVDNKVWGNDFTSIVAEANLTGDNTDGYGYAAGMYISSQMQSENGKNRIYNNTVKTVQADIFAEDGTASVHGAKVQYCKTLDVDNNTFKGLTSRTESASSDLDSHATGVYGPYLSDGVTVTNTLVKSVVATSTYTQGGTESEQYQYGFYVWSSPNTVLKNNTVREFTGKAKNNNVDDYNDATKQYGLYMAYSPDSTVKSNKYSKFLCKHSNGGADGVAHCFQYGMYLADQTNTTVQGNAVANHDAEMRTADFTEFSYQDYVSYGVYAKRSSDLAVNKNKVFGHNADLSGYGSNGSYSYLYGFFIDDVVRSTFMGNDAYGLSATSGAWGYMETYGAYIRDSHNTVFQRNKMKDFKTRLTGASGDVYAVGMYVQRSNPVYLDGNVVRGWTNKSNGSLQIRGMQFNGDASQLRATNNMVVGKRNNSANENTGVKFESESTEGAQFVNNTVAHWRAPMYIEAGKSFVLRNNIYHAIGADSYCLMVGMNNVTTSGFDFDYNLFNNASSTDKNRLVYDSDNAQEIHFGDWKNKDGSYGYDVHSMDKKPRLNSSGFLKAGSDAINAGTSNYNTANKATKYLKKDVQSEKRPAKKGTRVDIGADEYQ